MLFQLRVTQLTSLIQMAPPSGGLLFSPGSCGVWLLSSQPLPFTWMFIYMSHEETSVWFALYLSIAEMEGDQVLVQIHWVSKTQFS